MERTVPGRSDIGLAPAAMRGSVADARFPTVVVGCGAEFGGVHLGSWAVGHWRGDGSGSRLNDRERG